MAGERPEGGAPATRTHELAAEGEGMRHCPRFARLGVAANGVLSMLIGTFWLGAWMTGYAARHGAAGLITMKTNMALALFLGGSALLLLGTGRRIELRRRWVGAALAALVLLIGAITLSEHLVGWDLGIDQLLAKEATGVPGTIRPNRIGPPGSASLTLLGLGLLALAWRRCAIIPYLGLAVCVINLVPTVGFLYRIDPFYATNLTAIAWPTVIALPCLGLGLILTRTDAGPMPLLLSDDPGGALLRRMLPIAVLLSLALGYLKMQVDYAGIGVVSERTGTLIVVLILAFSALLWHSAARLSRSSLSLRESEERYRTLFETAPDAIVVHRDGRFLYANGAALLLTGAETFQQLVRHTVLDFFRPQDREQSLERTRMVMAGNRLPIRQSTLLRLDGQEVEVEFHTAPVSFQGARAILTIIRDVTERKRAEEALRENQGLVQAVMEGSPDLIYVKDADGRVLMANPAACEALSRSAEDVIGKTAREFHSDDPDVGRAILKNDRQVMESGETQTFEEPGSKGRTYLSTKAPYRSADGDVVGLIGISHDITERKRAERQLEANLAALTRMHVLSTKLLDADGLELLLQEITDGAVAIVGAERGTLQLIEGDSLRIVAHCGHQRPFLEFFAFAESRASVCGEAMKHGQRVVVEDVERSPLFAGTQSLKVLRDAGVRAVQATPLLDRQGTLVGILTTQWSVPHIPDEHDLWRIDLLARQAADLIEHKQTEEELRLAYGRLQTFFDHRIGGIGIVIANAKGDILQANDYYLSILGCTREELVSAQVDWRRMTPAEWLPADERALAQLRERGVCDTYEKEYVRRDGSRVPVLITDAMMPGDSGDILAFVLDITERKRAEEALREAHERAAWLARFPEENPNPVLRASAEGAVLYCNPATAQVSGWTCEIGGTLGAPFLSLVQRALTEGRQVKQDVELGGRSYAVWAAPVPSERYANVYGRDITDRKQAEEALRAKEAELELILSRTPFMFTRCSRDLRYLYVSRAYAEMIRRTQEEMAGKPILEVIGEKSFQTIRPYIERVLRGETVHYEAEVPMPDGDAHFLDVVYLPDKDEQGQVIGWVASLADIAERKKAEEALRQSEENARRQAEELATLMDVTPTAVWVSNDPRCGVITGNRAAQRFYEATKDENLSAGAVGGEQDCTRRFFQDGRELTPEDLPMQVAAAQAIDVRDSEIDVVLPSGRRITILGNASPLLDAEGRVRGSIAAFVDITDRKRGEEALKRALLDAQQRCAETSALMESTRVVLEHRDLIPPVRAVFDACRRLLGAQAGYVVVLTADGKNNELLFLEAGGLSCTVDSSLPMPVRGFRADVYRTGRVLYENDFANSSWAKLLPRGHVPLENVLFAPLMVEGCMIGLLGLGNKPGGFTDNDATLAGTFGELVAIALRNSRTLETLRELNATLESKVAERTAELEQRNRQLQRLALELTRAEDRERRRIAGVLHEDLQQQIAGAKFHLSLLNGRAGPDPKQQAVVANIDEMLRDAIEQSRSLSHELSPAVLHQNDLAEALRWLARRMQAMHGLAVHVDTLNEMALQSDALTIFLFRAAQEILFNVVRHAGVKEAAVRAARRGRYIRLSVRDRGQGFDPGEIGQSVGFGLVSIRERAELLGGRMRIKSAKDQGSSLYVIVPDEQQGLGCE